MKKKQQVGMGYWMVAVWMVAALVTGACAAAPSASRSENAAPPMAGAPAAEPSADSAAVAQAPGAEGTVVDARKIIARATIDLTVVDTEATVAEITTLMDELGGYVSDSNLSRSTYGSVVNAFTGSITLRVPTENLDAALDALAAMAVEVDSRSINREDVTDQYSDVDAQIRNLEATEQELLAMLEEVRERPNSTTEDIMSVYRTLTEVRGQIETLRGRKNMWDNLISLSTIEVYLRPDSATQPIVDEGWRPGGVARDAQRALVDAAQGLGNVAIWFVIFFVPLILVFLIPLAILIWVLRLLVRRFSKAKPKLAVTPTPPPAPSA